jgi:WD40 repeat protein
MHACTGTVLGLAAFAALASAAPAPAPKPVISVETAKRVVRVGEIPRDVWELVWVARKELTLHGWEAPVEVLDPVTFRPLREIAAGRRLVHFAASADGKAFAFCENGTAVEVHRLPPGPVVRLNAGQDQPALAFSPDGKLLATGGYGTQAKLWGTTSGGLVRALDAPGKGGLTPVFSPDGKLLAVGNRNDVTRVFEVETGKLLHTLPRRMSQELRFSPNGKVLAVAYVDGGVGLWDVGSGKLLQHRPSGAKEVYTLDWSPAGDVLVTAGLKGKITLWDARDLSALQELEAPEWVIRVRFSPDGRRLFSCGGMSSPPVDRKVTVWGLDAR